MIIPKAAGFALMIVFTSARFAQLAATFSVHVQGTELGNSQSHVAEMIGDTTDAFPPHFLLDLYECLASNRKETCLESLQDMRSQDYTISGVVGHGKCRVYTTTCMCVPSIASSSNICYCKACTFIRIFCFFLLTVLGNESHSNNLMVSFSNLAPSNSLHAVEVHVFKEALSVIELINIVNTPSFNMSNGVEVEFYFEAFVNGTTKRYTETSKITLSMNDLVRSQWIVLTGLKTIYSTWIDSESNELLLNINVNQEYASIIRKLHNESEGWEPALFRVLASQHDEIDFFKQPLFSSKSRRSQQFEDLNEAPDDVNMLSTRCRKFDYSVSTFVLQHVTSNMSFTQFILMAHTCIY